MPRDHPDTDNPLALFTSRFRLRYNAPMEFRTPQPDQIQPSPLAWWYTRVFLGYLVLMGALWVVGLEGIYGHPTPFYALFYPVAGTATTLAMAAALLIGGLGLPGGGPRARQIVAAALGLVALIWLFAFAREAHREDTALLAWLGGRIQALGWHLPWVIVTVAGGFCFQRYFLPHLDRADDLDRRTRLRLLAGLMGFAIAFACATAMLRGGAEGIYQAYARTAYEYVGDIGKTRDIQSLFSRYLEIHEHLSMHAKVHPPGPIALLWLMSFFVGNGPLALSLATILFSSLAIFPLYGWARRVTGCARTALLSCLLYVLAPSVVLFTATSADALFTPFTLATLYCFERAIRTDSAPFALVAGLGYGAMILLKFSLIGIGAYFGLVGLWLLRDPATRRQVIQTAALMLAGSAGLLFAVYLWSGFDVIETFHVAKAQFDTDQRHLDELAPRLPTWTYRLLNPLCWFYFAGIPLSLLAIREFFRGDRARRPLWMLFALMLLALNLLYLARGEGERSAMYMIPFVAIPAAAHLERLAQHGRGPLWVTVAFLLFQCWFTEAVFYTYW